VKAKRNIASVLQRELRYKPRGVVGVSTVTDPYQPLEARLGLTRMCLEALLAHGFPVSIQTKSNLVLRDMDLVKPGGFDVGVTITTMDEDLARRLEPRASRPEDRVAVLEAFAARKAETWVFLGPIIPKVNDGEESLERVVDVAYKTGSRVTYDKLNLRPWVFKSIAVFMEGVEPGLLSHLPSLLTPSSGYWQRVASTVRAICIKKGVSYEEAFPEST